MARRLLFLTTCCLFVIGCESQSRNGNEALIDTSTSELVAPCYTPCEVDLERNDGTRLTCSNEGLMAGCLDDKVCNLGSCGDEGADPPSCENDLE
jgi:hypothetical protein